jgi:hypothetical protein
MKLLCEYSPFIHHNPFQWKKKHMHHHVTLSCFCMVMYSSTFLCHTLWSILALEAPPLRESHSINCNLDMHVVFIKNLCFPVWFHCSIPNFDFQSMVKINHSWKWFWKLYFQFIFLHGEGHKFTFLEWKDTYSSYNPIKESFPEW